MPEQLGGNPFEQLHVFEPGTITLPTSHELAVPLPMAESGLTPEEVQALRGAAKLLGVFEQQAPETFATYREGIIALDAAAPDARADALAAEPAEGSGLTEVVQAVLDEEEVSDGTSSFRPATTTLQLGTEPFTMLTVDAVNTVYQQSIGDDIELAECRTALLASLLSRWPERRDGEVPPAGNLTPGTTVMRTIDTGNL